ncbi:hypothetical protein E2C01_019586 [Portunus trituberculatus]|uniref:Uncharacterized protein n=1 Tax=Portunus trituberculatus TaxID=210409 RepID=A0A5B7DZD4_PORTR|nr:hypothetical protein [Portunus trituberculatus]
MPHLKHIRHVFRLNFCQYFSNSVRESVQTERRFHFDTWLSVTWTTSADWQARWDGAAGYQLQPRLKSERTNTGIRFHFSAQILTSSSCQRLILTLSANSLPPRLREEGRDGTEAAAQH